MASSELLKKMTGDEDLSQRLSTEKYSKELIAKSKLKDGESATAFMKRLSLLYPHQDQQYYLVALFAAAALEDALQIIRSSSNTALHLSGDGLKDVVAQLTRGAESIEQAGELTVSKYHNLYKMSMEKPAVLHEFGLKGTLAAIKFSVFRMILGRKQFDEHQAERIEKSTARFRQDLHTDEVATALRNLATQLQLENVETNLQVEFDTLTAALDSLHIYPGIGREIRQAVKNTADAAQ